MGSHFFTNQDDNSLINKFEGVFDSNDIQKFDALVGYLKASGYFRIRPFLEDVEHIRILAGIEADRLFAEARSKGQEFRFANDNQTRKEFLRDLKHDIQSADYDKKVEGGILQLVKDVAEGKIEIKAHPSKKLHSKIYIFRPKTYNEHNPGSVITGSSNLTPSGLEHNFEFNVELRNFDDVAFALKTFEDLWEEAVDILPESVEAVKNDSYLNDDFSPFEIYIKFLIEYFGKSIEYDPEAMTDLPRGYRKLYYQVDAVNDGYNKLMQHNGFILADVVGLGKTIVATIIAKKFYFSNGYRTKILVVHPPALETNWRDTIRDFEVPNVDFITNGSLHNIRHPEDYDLIIVDEAHKFRSDDSQRFNELQKLCKTQRKTAAPDGTRDKKVMLVTATPLNNRPKDIRNLLYLFQDSKDSSLEVRNLQSFFRPLIDQYKKLKKEADTDKIRRKVKEIYDTIRTKVLEPVIVRRTRTDIKKTPEYWEDMKEQGFTFPDVETPKQVLYELDPELNTLYDNTLDLIKDTKSGLKYYRYQAIRFLPADIKKDRFNKRADVISEQLASIMKTLLVKRLDSSFYAFRKSLERYYDNNRAMIQMLESGQVYIAPKLNVSEMILEGQEESLQEMMLDPDIDEDIQAFSTSEFKDEFEKGMRKDQEILKSLLDAWNKVDYDPKLDTLVEKLETEFFEEEKNDHGKLVVFSESKETTSYLTRQLKKRGYNRILSVSSDNQRDLAETIAHNFDANIALTKQENNYDIVITTEVLAEGVNLHRSNIIVNYDIPWNATRLMQRIGRVNRIGTDSDKIYIYNFFPTLQTDNEIELNKKAFMKLQAFHSALGEDSQIYSEDEEFDSFGLFEKVPEEERDERLVYLTRLRRFRDQEPEKFNKIRAQVPKRARCGRKDRSRSDSTITYLKTDRRDAFYHIDKNGKLEELTFVEAARIYEAHATERAFDLHGHHHEQVKQALTLFNEGIQKAKVEKRVGAKMGPNEKKALAFLSALAKQEFVDEYEDKQIKWAMKAINKGRFQQLPREINRLQKDLSEYKRIEAYELLIDILNKYPLDEEAMSNGYDDADKSKTKRISKSGDPEIIISESFSKK